MHKLKLYANKNVAISGMHNLKLYTDKNVVISGQHSLEICTDKNVAISGMQKIETRSDVQAMDIKLGAKSNQEEHFGGSGEMEEN